MQNTPKTIEERVEEFRQKAYPVVHSNAFPEKDFIYLEELCNYFRKAISEQDRISRESEREKIIELFKNGEWRKMIDKNGGNDFDVMTRAFLQTLTNKE